ncbi:hypothetical protein HZS55_00725 [Halosimplex rubrum]|uniref:Zinc ribbon domain-containing protein n=1 Tax=Halosimplex rubrum TaxID=869889 RepID=A0A7D5TLK0_9EURY|nr:hypothetical protein [Halosimplex rubrum]QLH75914.1 hypothetical protein HZS55_00725 [Halosimplex rubrum]
MVSFVAVIVFAALASLALGLVAFVGATALGRLASLSPRKEASMPSHYSTLVHTTPSKYPGYCPECETNNDPDYTVCRNCSAKLPDSRYERDTRTVNTLFDEQ